MNKSRFIALAVLAALGLGILVGCGSNPQPEEPPKAATEGGNSIHNPALTGSDSPGGAGGGMNAQKQTQTAP